MKHKANSYFLLFLFSIVMLFPGYGLATKSRSASALSRNEVSFHELFKRCLSGGISNSAAAEERSSEEESGDGQISELGYLLPEAPALACFELRIITFLHSLEPDAGHVQEIPSPPPNCC